MTKKDYDLFPVSFSDKMICYQDLFDFIGVTDIVSKRFNSGAGKQHIDNIRACNKTCAFIEGIFAKNIVKSKDKRVKNLTIEGKRKALSWNILMISPLTDEKIPAGYIAVVKEESEHFRRL